MDAAPVPEPPASADPTALPTELILRPGPRKLEPATDEAKDYARMAADTLHGFEHVFGPQLSWVHSMPQLFGVSDADAKQENVILQLLRVAYQERLRTRVATYVQAQEALATRDLEDLRHRHLVEFHEQARKEQLEDFARQKEQAFDYGKMFSTLGPELRKLIDDATDSRKHVDGKEPLVKLDLDKISAELLGKGLMMPPEPEPYPDVPSPPDSPSPFPLPPDEPTDPDDSASKAGSAAKTATPAPDDDPSAGGS